MVIPNVDNNTLHNKSQDDNNFKAVKGLLKYVWKLDITLSALRILLYQIDQEFGFIKDGKVKDGDRVTHIMRSRHLGISKNTEIEATQELERLNIITVERKHRIVNRYHINRDTSTWLLSSDTIDTSDTPDTTEYTFNSFQTKELLKYCTEYDLETEKLWLMSHGIPQDKAFGTLLNKLSHVTK